MRRNPTRLGPFERDGQLWRSGLNAQPRKARGFSPVLVHVVEGRVDERCDESGGHGQQRQMCGNQQCDPQGLLALGVPTEQPALVGRVEMIVAATVSVVLAPVEVPDAGLVLADAVQHVAVERPLGCVRV